MGGGKHVWSRAPSLSLAQLGAGMYEGRLRYELHVRKCDAMGTVIFTSRGGEGSPKPSQPLGQDSLCPILPPSRKEGPEEGRHREDRSHHVRTWHGMACGIFLLVSPWCRPS